MNERRIHKVVIVATVLGVLWTIINVSYRFLLPMYLSLKFKSDFNDAQSIGIIGGADGPTTIYVANSNYNFITVIVALLTVIGIMYLIITSKRRNRK